jgi:hypothetical protein
MNMKFLYKLSKDGTRHGTWKLSSGCINVHLRETGRKVVDWTKLARDRVQ